MALGAMREKLVADVALAVVHDPKTDMVLLIRRGRSKDFSGWAFPGGKVEQSDTGLRKESAVEAARRELQEETGLRAVKVGREIFCRRHPSTGVIIRYVYFRSGANGAAWNAEPSKADDCAWVSLNNLNRIFSHGLSDGLMQGIRRQGRKLSRAHALCLSQGDLELDVTEAEAAA